MLYAAALPLIVLVLTNGPAFAQAKQPAKNVVVNAEQQAEAERLRACPSGRWRWEGNEFATPTARASQELDVPGGRLIGTDRGEWRGELRFRSLAGQESVLSHDNVLGILPVQDGAIVLFGLTHMRTNRGYAMLARQKDSVWSLTLIDKFPGKPVAVYDLDYHSSTFGKHFAVATSGDINAKASVAIVNEFSAWDRADCMGEPPRRRPR
ncbi:MAG: hypothetical protein GY873_27010 [Bosea sp.]|uniref:hypothetical protein n=1 Tax=Bosea sp. (in: a-proteobacteria) TaxID=1871050 RepID=UPI002388A715|nr:hypothetical protein [Bosea sp. (in: a-proteobacteria)]MCP4737848.1 hypothetical protein [Bosea sp. (in: a-proteobacteria)]